MTLYRVRIITPIHWKGANIKPGDEITVTRQELDYLGPCAVSIAVKREEKARTATAKPPPENTMRKRR